jgi:hypothetical protein
MKNLMKKAFVPFLMLLTVMLVSWSVQAQYFQYEDSWGKQGFQLTEQKSNGVEVTYSINSFSVN